MALFNLHVHNRAAFKVLTVIAILFNLALIVGGAWVAWHFISKWW